ncbi:MAG: tripartite tricarboxylate transporter substrate binding protein [Betaproteobacteria bacterium]|nr:tripartite tricarboxylate transporter substrate binding protein [Betaproteobacteria bacterium]
MRQVWGVVAFVVLAGPLSVASGQDYPVRPVRIVAPFAPGGSTDVLTRLVGQKLNARWKQSVVVENRVGASGRIGAEYVAKSAAADGYTLLMAGAPHAIGMTLFRKLNYDLARDLAPIGLVATFPSVIVAHPTLPVKSVKDLIALARSRPGQIDFGSPNIGSPNHLVMELVKTMAKVNMTHIPYKGGSGQMVGDLVAGHVQIASMGFPPAIPQIKTGRLRAIAVTSAKRSPLLPAVPTVSESGLPGFEVNSWYGLFGPAGLPAALRTRLNGDVVAILGDADLKERLATLGAEPGPMPADEFGRFVRSEIAKWAKVVKASGASAD